jgi:hypothetical protein
MGPQPVAQSNPKTWDAQQIIDHAKNTPNPPRWFRRAMMVGFGVPVVILWVRLCLGLMGLG